MTKLRSASSTHTLASHIMILLTFSLLIPIITPISYAQIPEKHAELIRLLLMREKAEEAMSMGDPEGASLNAGKAALMAALSGAYLHPKLAIAVDDDIDANDLRQIMWSITTRVHAERDIVMLSLIHI